MERYTQHSRTGWQVPEGLEQAAAERLAHFEDAYEDIRSKQARLEEQMESLRAAGKQKSVRFRELLGEKLMLQQMVMILESHGLT